MDENETRISSAVFGVEGGNVIVVVKRRKGPLEVGRGRVRGLV
jgi:hypothetical protein